VLPVAPQGLIATGAEPVLVILLLTPAHRTPQK
jgi:hypothetical protein